MEASLYIYNDSFKCGGEDDLSSIKRKFSELQNLFEEFRKYPKEHHSYFIEKDEFLKIPIAPNGVTVYDLISDYENAVQLLGKDIITLVLKLAGNYCKEICNCDDIVSSVLNGDNCDCAALVVLNLPIGHEDNRRVINNVKSWHRFRRYILSLNPGTSSYFLDEVKKCYDRLEIHDSTSASLKDVIDSHTKQIVNALSILNDYLLEEYFSTKLSWPNFLNWFAGAHHLDGASLEGQKEDTFKFDFANGTHAYCEPHLKMNRDDNGMRHYCRIYFKKPDSGEKKVYVGRICTHL